MKKLVLAVAALAVFAASDVVAGCKTKRCNTKTHCAKSKCAKPCKQVVETCEEKPVCVQRCVVERCVEPKKIVHVSYECPTTCEQMEPGYVAQSKEVTRKSGSKRMKTNEAY